ncbi:MAG TPA: superoxide dismutase family protein [Allosphingosinicella sp.]|nr:superoxide dismutase family protein [Allosphingosinicella sp.]
MKACLIYGCAALAVAACVPRGERVESAPAPQERLSGSAELRDAAGAVRARAAVEQEDGGVRVRVEATDMSPGAYGVHIHAIGRCDPPDFASAGPHWNPTGRMHGRENPDGPHKGDLPNLLVGADARGSFEYRIPDVAIGAGRGDLFDEDGAALVIHERADDLRTDPSGNSGARIACGVLR